LFSVQFIKLREYLAVFSYIRHGTAIVFVTYQSIFVDDQLSWHASQFKYFDFLPVQFRYAVIRVGQAYEGHFIFMPPVREHFGILRAYGYDFGTPLDELLIFLTQLRHMLAAVRSNKAAVEDEDDVLVTFVA